METRLPPASEHIYIDPLRNNTPFIKGTDIKVVDIAMALSFDGESVEDVVKRYPQLTEEQVQAAGLYTIEVLKQNN